MRKKILQDSLSHFGKKMTESEFGSAYLFQRGCGSLSLSFEIIAFIDVVGYKTRRRNTDFTYYIGSPSVTSWQDIISPVCMRASLRRAKM